MNNIVEDFAEEISAEMVDKVKAFVTEVGEEKILQIAMDEDKLTLGILAKTIGRDATQEELARAYVAIKTNNPMSMFL